MPSWIHASVLNNMAYVQISTSMKGGRRNWFLPFQSHAVRWTGLSCSPCRSQVKAGVAWTAAGHHSWLGRYSETSPPGWSENGDWYDAGTSARVLSPRSICISTSWIFLVLLLLCLAFKLKFSVNELSGKKKIGWNRKSLAISSGQMIQRPYCGYCYGGSEEVF